MQVLTIISKCNNLQSIRKALDVLELNFCKSRFYSLYRRKKCNVAEYNFGSVYKLLFFLKKKKTSEYYQEMPQSQIIDKPTPPYVRYIEPWQQNAARK